MNIFKLYMRHSNLNVSEVNKVNTLNTLNIAKNVFNFDNHVHVNSLFETIEICLSIGQFDTIYTLVKLLKERVKPEEFEGFGVLFNNLNEADHGTN